MVAAVPITPADLDSAGSGRGRLIIETLFGFVLA